MSRAPLRPATLSTALTLNEYNRFCRSLRHTTHVVQWGGAHVWKVGGKVFAIGRWNDDDQQLFITFKCSPMSYDMLKEISGCRPAPYLASRGMKWIQRTSAEELDDTGLKDYLRASYDTRRQVKTTARAAARSKAKPASRPAAQAPTNTKTKPTRARAAQRKGASQ
jgi:predicted DNA-binding protein (MmcQ/YjbR family)